MLSDYYFFRNLCHCIPCTINARGQILQILLRFGPELCGDYFNNSNSAVFKDSTSQFALSGQILGNVRKLIAFFSEKFSLSEFFERDYLFERITDLTE